MKPVSPVTAQSVVWSVKLVSGKSDEAAERFSMGVGWQEFIAAIKHIRCAANEEHGDTLLCTWTGTGSILHQWTWHATNDAPALLPNPCGFVLDSPVEL
jgi:hypothetical protein